MIIYGPDKDDLKNQYEENNDLKSFIIRFSQQFIRGKEKVEAKCETRAFGKS